MSSEIFIFKPVLPVGPSSIPPRPCHADKCAAPALPGIDMCAAHLAKFSPGQQALIRRRA